MGKYAALIEEVSKQEEELVFDSFDSSDALKIGQMLIEKAKANNVIYAINISLNRRQLFHFSMDGAMPDNDKWALKKENTVYNFSKSSYRIFLESEEYNWTLAGYGLPLDAYAAVGGSFPLTIRGAGVVGAISVSGLPHEEDHRYIVEAIKEYLLGVG